MKCIEKVEFWHHGIRSIFFLETKNKQLSIKLHRPHISYQSCLLPIGSIAAVPVLPIGNVSSLVFFQQAVITHIAIWHVICFMAAWSARICVLGGGDSTHLSLQRRCHEEIEYASCRCGAGCRCRAGDRWDRYRLGRRRRRAGKGCREQERDVGEEVSQPVQFLERDLPER